MTLRKVKEIRYDIESNTERQVVDVSRTVGGETQEIAPRFKTSAATTNGSGSFANLLPPARNLHYILPDFTTLESHPVGTLTIPTAIPQIPMMTSTGHAASIISGPGKHSAAGLFGDTRRYGFAEGAGRSSF